MLTKIGRGSLRDERGPLDTLLVSGGAGVASEPARALVRSEAVLRGLAQTHA